MQNTKRAVKKSWRNHLRAFRRTRLNPIWNTIKWPLVGFAWILALILGYIGFFRHSLAAGQQSTAYDVLYRTIQLIVLQSGDVEGLVPWQLNTARYLLPILAAYAAIQALLTIFSDHWQQLRIRFFRNHVVLCGLGERGLQISREFLNNGYQVVVIEEDEENPFLSQVCEQGAVVIIGNATDKSLLQRAGVHKARFLFAVCPDDGTNAEIAIYARDLVSSRKGRPLTAFVHIVDLDLCNLLGSWSLAASTTDSFRLEFFNVRERGAQLILKEHPPFKEVITTEEAPSRILIVGFGKLGRSLVVQAAKDWWMKNARSGKRLRITIIDRFTEGKLEMLRQQYPRLEKACELEMLQIDSGSPEFEKGAFLFDANGNCDLHAIYICFDNDTQALMDALTLQRKTKTFNVPIIMRMSRDAGLATLAKKDYTAFDFGHVHAFSLLEETCSLEALLGGSLEILAKAIHEDYVEHQKELGITLQNNPSMVDWEELPEELRESNRHKAAHVEKKMKAIGCDIQPLTDWDAAKFEFTGDELEMLTKMEHERWCEERIGQGWSYRPGEKNIRKRTSPHLVPWAELSPDAKQYALNMIKGLPNYLARAGYQIHRRA